MRILLLMCLSLSIFVTPLAAQYEPPPLEVFGGISFVSPDGLNGTVKGGQGEFVMNLSEKFSLLFDVGIQKKTFTVTFPDGFGGTITQDFKFTFAQIQTGFRYYLVRNERFSVFGHLMTGGFFISSGGQDSNAGTITPGGGVEIIISRKIAIRPVQVDAIIAQGFSGTGTNMRFAAGIVYRFGD